MIRNLSRAKTPLTHGRVSLVLTIALFIYAAPGSAGIDDAAECFRRELQKMEFKERVTQIGIQASIAVKEIKRLHEAGNYSRLTAYFDEIRDARVKKVVMDRLKSNPQTLPIYNGLLDGAMQKPRREETESKPKAEPKEKPKIYPQIEIDFTNDDSYAALPEPDQPIILGTPHPERFPSFLVTPLNSRGKEVRIEIFPLDQGVDAKGITLSFPDKTAKLEQIFEFPKEELREFVLRYAPPLETNQALVATYIAFIVILAAELEGSVQAHLVFLSGNILEEMLGGASNKWTCLEDRDDASIYCTDGTFVLTPFDNTSIAITRLD